MKKFISLMLCLFVLLSFVVSVSALSAVPVKGISIDKTTLTLDYGKTYTLKITITPSNTTQKGLLFNTSNKSIATIDSKGVIAAVGPGKATITVSSLSDKKIVTKCDVTVQPIVITMEHQDTEKPERALFYDRLAAKYTKLHPGVKIEITKAAFATASTTILTALSSGHPFDIYSIAVGDAGTWIDKHNILDLTKYFTANDNEWLKTFRDGVQSLITYGDGRIYNVPYFLDGAPLLYHIDIFKKDNVQPAKTKEEFYALCDRFKSEGYIPFEVHGSLMDDLMNVLSLQFEARDGIQPFDVAAGKIAFTGAWFKDTMTVFKEMYTRGYLDKSFWTVGGTDGRMAYSQSKMPMRFGFYWDVDTQKDMGLAYDNQGVASMPNFTGKDIKLYKVAGCSTFAVSSLCSNPDVAVDFLKFMTSTENQDDMAYKYFGRYPNGMMVPNKDVELSDYAGKYMADLASGIPTVFTPENVCLTSKYLDVCASQIPLFMQDKITLDQFCYEFEKLRAH